MGGGGGGGGPIGAPLVIPFLFSYFFVMAALKRKSPPTRFLFFLYKNLLNPLPLGDSTPTECIHLICIYLSILNIYVGSSQKRRK
jgi:hypothetical protein